MKQKFFSLILCFALTVVLFPRTAFASQEWPSDVSIEADAGIVMDADSGTVLYGKNIHDTFSPASITKVLTAVIVLENCQLDEMVTFSKNAVYNVEADSSSAGYDTGDQATVKDCLYALLLKSANESANALAEHVAGTTEDFAVMMNEKAKELGCVDSHFANPSGLNDENHYVSAYDMALITRYAFQNETFREIVSTTYYELPPNARNPEGLGVSPGNKLIKKNFPEYRSDVIGGKTGYTSIALNTLVAAAEEDGMTLITAVLHSHGTTYSDTSRMLDFGFQNFRSVSLKDNDTTYSSLNSNLTIAGLPTSSAPSLTVDPDSRIILPNSAEFDETTSSVSFELPQSAPDNAIGAILYSLGEHDVGTAWLTLGGKESGEPSIPEELLKAVPSTIAQVTYEDENIGASQEDASENSLEGKTYSEQEDGQTESEAAPSADSSHAENPADSQTPENQKEETSDTSSVIKPVLFAAAGAAVLLALSVLFLSIRRRNLRQEEAAQTERRRKRMERLKESGISEEEFNEMMKNRRLSIPLEPDRKPHHRRKSRDGSLLSGQKKKPSRNKGFTLKKRRRWRR